MHAHDVRSTEAVRHGAYLCLRFPPAAHAALAGAAVPALVADLGLRNEFEPGGDHPAEAIAFLRRVDATPAADIADDAVLHADAVVHVASATAAPVAALCAGLTRLVGAAHVTRVLAGVVRPMTYTGNAMHNLAYAQRVLQQPASVMPDAFLLPMCKIAAWWAMDWMERNTYFLPRFGDDGRLASEGHVRVSVPAIPHLMRRTYKHPEEPPPDGSYGFLTYFECAPEHVATFHAVCAALRDTARNPEWAFVREGPTWHGRRVATWAALFD